MRSQPKTVRTQDGRVAQIRELHQAHKAQRRIAISPAMAEEALTWAGVIPPKTPKRRGFAAINPEQHRAIAKAGGQASQASGRAHRYNPETAKQAGHKGGSGHSREHLAIIGANGGRASAATRKGKPLGAFCLSVFYRTPTGEERTVSFVRMRLVDCPPYPPTLFADCVLDRVPMVGGFMVLKRRKPGQTTRYRRSDFLGPVTKIERRRIKPQEAAPCPA